jgi:DNA helicase-2/ATP-dependent DNA helicase PcrA
MAAKARQQWTGAIQHRNKVEAATGRSQWTGGYTGTGNKGQGSYGQGGNFAVAGGGPVPSSPGDLEPGDRVTHERVGEGEVMAVEGEAPNTTALINFKSTGTKKLLLRFAKLTRL